MKSYAEIMETVRFIERRFPVNRLEYEGLHIWPWLRILMANDLFWNVSVHPAENLSNYREACGTSDRDGGAGRTEARDAIAGFRNKMNSVVGKQMASLGSPRVLFFTVGFEYARLEGKYYNRFYDPLKNLLSGMDISYGDICTGFDQPLYEPAFHPALSINQLRTIPPMIANMSCEHGLTGSIRAFEDFLLFCSDIALHVPLNYAELVKRLEHIIEYSSFYSTILESARPDLAFVVCYYHDSALAFINACRKRGVRSVEMQHSIICRNDWNWNHWDLASEACLDFLPEYFWAWSDKYAEMLLPSPALERDFLQPLVGGNLWIPAWKERFAAAENNHRSFKRRGTKTILYAAPVGNREMLPQLFPDAVLDAVNDSPDDWQWLFRVHYKTDDRLLAQMTRYLEERIGRADIHRSSDIQLYDLFELVDYQIAQTSTNLIEAEMFDIPNIVVGEEGKQWFRDEIDKGYYFHAGSGRDILAFLRDERRRNVRNRNVIDTDPSGALKSLYDLLFQAPSGGGQEAYISSGGSLPERTDYPQPLGKQ